MKLATLILLAAAAVPGAIDVPSGGYLGFDSRDLAAASKGAVVRELESDSSSRQLSVVGIVRIAAPPERILAQLRSERGLRHTESDIPGGLFSDPARLPDVSDYRLPESDIEVLARCRVASCKYKMGELGFREFGKIDWSAAGASEQASATARRIMVEYVNGYRADGATALVTYRDKEQPMSLASGLRRLLRDTPYFNGFHSRSDRYLVSFPEEAAARAQDSIHWALADFGYRPLTDIVHAVSYQPEQAELGEPAAFMTQKHIFTSHYFEARVEFFALFADGASPSASASYLAYLDRSRFDGDLGRFKRLLLLQGVVSDVRDRLMALRARIES